jgi:hypothetical protein
MIRWLGAIVGLVLVVLAAKGTCDGLTWSRAAAIGSVLGFSLVFNRWLFATAIGQRDSDSAEGFRWAFLQLLAAYAIHPYVRCAQGGAGDAYHYSISAADFIRQLRSGVFPVFIGQSEYAFNGGIHSVRTAPYFVHLSGVLDAITLHTLPFYAIGNLAVIFSVTMGVLGTYSALRIYAPSRAMTAWALTSLYILSPAILAPLYEGDMIATFMTVPMLPWWVLGLALASEEPQAWRPWLIQAAALAGMWWAHPPIACWATAVTALAWLLILARSPHARVCLERFAVAALVGAILASYEFASVFTLHLPHAPLLRASTAVAIPGNISRYWKPSLLPLSSDRNLLNDIQLGYSLMAAGLIGLFAARWRKSAMLLLACMAAILLLLVPLPVVTARLWSWVPNFVLDVTNAWPTQRLYPILAALAIFAAMAGATRLAFRNERRAALGTIIVAAGILWSGIEAHLFFAGREQSTASSSASARMFRPENVSLTRVSYLFFGRYPGYFSNSPMEPFLETRLLDATTLAVFADGSTVIAGKAPKGAYTTEFRLLPDGDIEPKIPVNPSETDVLRFDFGGEHPAGALEISGTNLSREYLLPSSGEDRAFGSGIKSGNVIAVRNTSGTQDWLGMNFLPAKASDYPKGVSRRFARISVEPYSPDDRVIALLSLIPFHALVRSDRESVLETPRIQVPGYRARVNGQATETLRTVDGFLGVPLPAGTSDVVVDYPGGRVLRWSYASCLSAWLALGICAIAVPYVDASGEFRRRLLMPRSLFSRVVRMLPIVALVIAILAVGAAESKRWWAAPNNGALRIVVKLPLGNLTTSEPLVTTGITGAGDVIYLSYLGSNRISVGHDSWGHPAKVSEPFQVNFVLPQTIEVSMRSLASPRPWGSKTLAGVSVKWNGREILSDERSPYPSGPNGVVIGANPIGASTCEPAFTGEVLESEPVEPWAK